MEKEQFIRICLNYKEFNGNIANTGFLSTGVIELTEPIEKILHELLSCVLTESGCDLFYWFMFEKGFIIDQLNELKLFQDGIEVPINTPDDLYDFLKKNNYITF